MEMNGLMGGLYRISEWIMRFAYIQLLWAVFSIVGLLFFGFFPATVGMFTVNRKWVMGETDIPVFKTFWSAYKKDFWKANAIGWLMLAFGYVIYFYMQLFKSYDGTLFLGLTILTWMIGIVYLMTFLFLIPTYVHYEIKLLRYFKYAAILALSHPFHVIMMGVQFVAFYYIMRWIPGLLPFLSVSILSFGIMWAANLVFNKMQKKAEEQEGNQENQETHEQEDETTGNLHV